MSSSPQPVTPSVNQCETRDEERERQRDRERETERQRQRDRDRETERVEGERADPITQKGTCPFSLSRCLAVSLSRCLTVSLSLTCILILNSSPGRRHAGCRKKDTCAQCTTAKQLTKLLNERTHERTNECFARLLSRLLFLLFSTRSSLS